MFSPSRPMPAMPPPSDIVKVAIEWPGANAQLIEFDQVLFTTHALALLTLVLLFDLLRFFFSHRQHTLRKMCHGDIIHQYTVAPADTDIA